MYTLVSAPVLGFDLVRRPGGGEVARLMVRALLLSPQDIAPLAAAARAADADAGREEAWRAVAEAERRRPEIPMLLRSAQLAAAVPATADEGTLRALESAPLGSLDGLLRCLRHDVLDWTWASTQPERPGLAVQHPRAAAATSVLCDALAASYLEEALPAPVRCRLAEPWVKAERRLPELPRGSALLAECLPVNLAAPLAWFLDRLAKLDAAEQQRIRSASESSRESGGAWASAVHDATWAVHLTGRARTAALAQMLAVEALIGAGVSVADTACGTWNLVSGAVQGLVVADLLSVPSLAELAMPLRVALRAPLDAD